MGKEEWVKPAPLSAIHVWNNNFFIIINVKKEENSQEQIATTKISNSLFIKISCSQTQKHKKKTSWTLKIGVKCCGLEVEESTAHNEMQKYNDKY